MKAKRRLLVYMSGAVLSGSLKTGNRQAGTMGVMEDKP